MSDYTGNHMQEEELKNQFIEKNKAVNITEEKELQKERNFIANGVEDFYAEEQNVEQKKLEELSKKLNEQMPTGFSDELQVASGEDSNISKTAEVKQQTKNNLILSDIEVGDLEYEEEILSKRLVDIPKKVNEDGRKDILSRWKTQILENRMKILYNDKRAKNEDSPEMKKVKASVAVIDNLLSENATANKSVELIAAYDSAIDVMKAYEKARTPFTSEGRRRKKRVTTLRKTLESEKIRLNEIINKTLIIDTEGSMRDVIAEKDSKNTFESQGIKENEQFVDLYDEVSFLEKDGNEEDYSVLQSIKDSMRDFRMLLRKGYGDDEDENKKLVSQIKQAQTTMSNSCRDYLKTHKYNDMDLAKDKYEYNTIEKVYKYVEKYRFLKDTNSFGKGMMLSYYEAIKRETTDSKPIFAAFNDLVKVIDTSPVFDEKKYIDKNGKIRYEKLFDHLGSVIAVMQHQGAVEWEFYYKKLWNDIVEFISKHIDGEAIERLYQYRNSVFSQLISEYKEYQKKDIPKEFDRPEEEIKEDKTMQKEVKGKSSEEIKKKKHEKYLDLVFESDLRLRHIMNVFQIMYTSNTTDNNYIKEFCSTMKRVIEQLEQVKNNDYTEVIPVLEKEAQSHPAFQTFLLMIEMKDFKTLKLFIESNREDFIDEPGSLITCYAAVGMERNYRNLIEEREIISDTTKLLEIIMLPEEKIKKSKVKPEEALADLTALLKVKNEKFPKYIAVSKMLQEKDYEGIKKFLKKQTESMEYSVGRPAEYETIVGEMAQKNVLDSGWLDAENVKKFYLTRDDNYLSTNIDALKEVFPESTIFSFNKTMVKNYEGLNRK